MGTLNDRLIPDRNILLKANGCDGERFSQLFRDCWERIPSTAKASICTSGAEQGVYWPHNDAEEFDLKAATKRIKAGLPEWRE